MELLRLSAHDAALRLSRGEELMESLLQAAELLRLESASVTGLGAASRAEIGVLLGASKAFLPRLLSEGDYEITSIAGNLSRLEGRPYAHIHATFADADGATFGGHLKSAVISATAELFLRCYDAPIGRRFDAGEGIYLMDW